MGSKVVAKRAQDPQGGMCMFCVDSFGFASVLERMKFSSKGSGEVNSDYPGGCFLGDFRNTRIPAYGYAGLVACPDLADSLASA